MEFIRKWRDRIHEYALTRGHVQDPDGADYYDDEEIYEDEADYEERPSLVDDGRSFSRSWLRSANDYDYAPRTERGRRRSERSDRYDRADRTDRTDRYEQDLSAKIYPFPNNDAQTIMNIRLINPSSIDECSEIVDLLRDGHSVIVNLESVKHDVAQRIVDFLAGTVHAFSGGIEIIAHKTFLCVPKGVDVSGKVNEEIKTSSILPALKTASR